jgi:hypothetical protein
MAERADASPMTSSLALRVASEADAHAIGRLAALDSAAVPAAPLLVAERDGAMVAAISLPAGAVIADPFAPTADVVEMLRMRRGQAVPKRRRAFRGLSALRDAVLEQPAQLA